jgi:uncharacterized protein
VTISGTFVFAGPPPAVWDLLHDAGALAKALPGTKTLTRTGDDRYHGTMKVTIGPLTAAEFAVTVTLKDQAPTSHFVMDIDAKGGVGFARGTATVDLAPAEDGTLTTYTSDVMVGGRIAAVGQRLIESVAKMMLKHAFDMLNTELKSRLGATS